MTHSTLLETYCQEPVNPVEQLTIGLPLHECNKSPLTEEEIAAWLHRVTPPNSVIEMRILDRVYNPEYRGFNTVGLLRFR